MIKKMCARNCERCEKQSTTIDTRVKNNNLIRRRHCLNCQIGWTTIETRLGKSQSIRRFKKSALS